MKQLKAEEFTVGGQIRELDQDLQEISGSALSLQNTIKEVESQQKRLPNERQMAQPSFESFKQKEKYNG
ncbi:MAG: hypothetical protein PHG14_15095 [Desulfobacter postgatei]|uniref:hypothetical protein n=1 Tax=Desulfobacter postgatei TaxID=2293 RepID=UPI0023F0A98A|nr:hypothetical protein [Desulfobacter postgatei]MDD4275039.1 hypothetical protein [Desulfobacter postgatei]